VFGGYRGSVRGLNGGGGKRAKGFGIGWAEGKKKVAI